VAKPTPVNASSPPHRLERIFAYIFAALVGLSIVCFAVVIIATASGLKGNEFKGGFWQTIALLPGIGLPIAFVLVIVLLILNMRRRARESQPPVTNKKK
jgi:uncharacterized membrane protein